MSDIVEPSAVIVGGAYFQSVFASRKIEERDVSRMAEVVPFFFGCEPIRIVYVVGRCIVESGEAERYISLSGMQSQFFT